MEYSFPNHTNNGEEGTLAHTSTNTSPRRVGLRGHAPWGTTSSGLEGNIFLPIGLA